MTEPAAILSGANELLPHLLYRVNGQEAQFATWRVTTGHEAVALFTSAEAAEKYRAELADPAAWHLLTPARDKLLHILQACRATGILYAALDPSSAGAKTLFDIPQVLAGVAERKVRTLNPEP